MGQRDGGYLVEAVKDAFPGAKTGRSCLNLMKPELVDDDAVTAGPRELGSVPGRLPPFEKARPDAYPPSAARRAAASSAARASWTRFSPMPIGTAAAGR